MTAKVPPRPIPASPIYIPSPEGSSINPLAALKDAELTGIPTAPTAAPGTNTTQIATTAFVQANSIELESMNWLGAWDADTTYAIGDAVSYLGESWFAAVASTGTTPVEGSTWNKIAAKGADGADGATGATGPAGEKGDKGDKGDTGDTGATGPAGADGATALSGLTDVDLTGASTGDSLVKDSDGLWKPQAISGGTGGSGVTRFDIEAPNDPPSDLDDDFDDTTLDSKWIQVNWSGLTASDVNTTAPSALYARAEGATSALHRAVMQALPAGDFTVHSAVNMATEKVSFQYAGILLSDGTTAGAGNQACAALVQSNNADLQRFIQKGTGFSGFSSTLSGPLGWYGMAAKAFIRVRRSGTTYSFAFSADGRLWKWAEFSTSSLGFTPTHIGLFVMKNAGSTATLEAAFDFFRYSASATAGLGGFR